MNIRVLSAICPASPGSAKHTAVRVSLEVSPDDRGAVGPITVRICLIDRRGAPAYGLAGTGRVSGRVEVEIPLRKLPDGAYTGYVLASASGARFEGGPIEVEVGDGKD